MPATVDGDVADGDVAAQLQGNGFIACAYRTALHVAGLFGIMLRQSLTVNHAVTSDVDVLLPFGPDQRVVEISMSTILILRKATERLALVVRLHFCRGSQNLRASHQVQVYITLQPDASTEIRSCRQQNLSAAIPCGCFYRFVDGHMVKSLAITLGPIVTHVIDTRYCSLHAQNAQGQQHTA